MPRVLMFLLCFILLIFVSCGLKKTLFLSDPETNTAKISKNNSQISSKLPNKSQKSDTKIISQKKETKKNNLPDITIPEKLPEEFSFKDKNGVLVTKKNGLQITRFPNGEVYYLPDNI